MANKVVLVGLWFALSLSAAISQDVKGQTSQGTVVPSSTTTASEQTTSNLITSGTSHTWSGVTTGTLPANYMPGGPAPIYDPSTNTVTFSYNATVAQTIAINNALANVGAGVKINGYNYSYDIRNMNGDNRQGGTDTLNVYQNLVSTTGTSLLSSQQTYNTKFEWQSVSGTRTANTPIDMANASYLKFSMVGGDNGYWGGYFGPSVRNVNMSLNYTVDQCSVNPQSSPSCPGFKTFYNIGDDGYAQVNSPFTFPFYGRNFTTSYMFSNGVVGFLDPSLHGNGFCCDGVDLSSNPGSPWNFAIYALQTDLIAANPDAKFYTQSDSTYMKYTWEKINEYGTNNLNTFSTTIKPTGYIGIQHDTINVRNHNVTVGIAGDLSLSQYSQYYTGAGSSFVTPTSILTYTGTEVVDYCASNPLYSPTCSGYQQAYFGQQCSLNQMYSVDCPGYAQSYLNYQCSIDPLYSTTCQGYEQAYHDQQCSVNQLYATDCPGYDAAYLTQQCSINSLYSTSCPNYVTAYKAQQCSLNALYDKTCTGYAEAYALKYVIVTPTATPVQTVSTAVAVSTTDPVASTTAVVADPVVNNVIATPAPSASPTSSSPVQLAPQPQPAQAMTAVSAGPTEGKKNDSTSSVSAASTTQASSSETKPSGPTARQELAAKREAAAKAKAVEEGKNLANEMGKVADMEGQKQLQNIVIQAMGFTPGFDAYNKIQVPDGQIYKPFTVYKNQVNVDNAKLGRRMYGPSDALHDEMISTQWELK